MAQNTTGHLDNTGDFYSVNCYEKGWDRQRWRDGFVYVARRVYHTADITRKVIQLLKAESGDDQKFKTAARGKLMSAIGSHIV